FDGLFEHVLRTDNKGNRNLCIRTYRRVKQIRLLIYVPFVAQIVPLICTNGSWATSGSVINTGGSGTGSTQLSGPFDVFIDSNQNIYVADSNNQRVQQWQSGQTNGSTIAGVTSQSGNGFNQFNSPTSVFVDINDNLYVADLNNYRVQRWASNSVVGTTVAGGNGQGPALTQLGTTYSIYVDTNDSVYVSELGNHRVTKWASGASSGVVVAGGAGAGSSATQLQYPVGVTIQTSTGNIYIADQSNHRVQRVSPGSLTGTTVAGQTGTCGIGSSQLCFPKSVQFDTLGNMYIVDSSNNRIQRWAPNAVSGTTILQQGSGSGLSQLNAPNGGKFDLLGNYYVVDTTNNRIMKYASSCVPTTTASTIATSGSSLMSSSTSAMQYLYISSNIFWSIDATP
ncbi:unnamed protein product, partial [Didymodactylos carnosus]